MRRQTEQEQNGLQQDQVARISASIPPYESQPVAGTRPAALATGASAPAAAGADAVRVSEAARFAVLGEPGSRGGAGAEPSEDERRAVAALEQADREVRQHEAAHAAVGGAHAGVAHYTYAIGPDGKRYAVGGEVAIDVSPVPNDPEATIRKMEQIARAAMAPADPSSADRAVAAAAQAEAAKAREELVEQRRTETEDVETTPVPPPYGPKMPRRRGLLLNEEA